MFQLRSLAPALAGLCLLLAARSGAATFSDTFSTNPLLNGWSTFGDASLFYWNESNQNIEVTWDSSRSNSYLHRPLEFPVGRSDDFRVAFDLRLDDIGPGDDPDKPYSFQLALGLLNLQEATQAGFLRGTGADSPDVVEFNYFWDSGYGSTVWSALVDSSSVFFWPDNQDPALAYRIFDIAPGEWYRVAFAYTASNQVLVTTITNFAATSGARVDTPLASCTPFTDFRVDTLSISSYIDTGAYGGSILAHGVVDNIEVELAPPAWNLAGGFTNGAWQVQFNCRSNWIYTLQRTGDFAAWTGVDAAPGGGPTLLLQDTNPPMTRAFYRVQAIRP